MVCVVLLGSQSKGLATGWPNAAKSGLAVDPILYPIQQVSGTLSLRVNRLELNFVSTSTSVKSVYRFTSSSANTFKLGIYTEEQSEISVILHLIHSVS